MCEGCVARELQDPHLAMLVRREVRGEVIKRLLYRIDHAVHVELVIRVEIDLDRDVVPPETLAMRKENEALVIFFGENSFGWVREDQVLDFKEAYAEKAREGTITLEELQGGTFSITNGGVFGSLMSTPLLNPPQSAILGMHTIKQRPVVVDGDIAVRPMMYLALSYDHRIIDGKDSVQFLVAVKNALEDPARLLLGL